MPSELRIVTTMMGDYKGNPTVYTKHCYFFQALSKRFKMVDIFDAGLQGLSRWINALSVAERDRMRWRVHFYKNPSAFHKRSGRVRNFLRSRQTDVDVNLQIG